MNSESGQGLCGALYELAGSDYYPFHMPGHKRNVPGRPLEALYRVDITEIDGFDNLHEPESILLEGMEIASQLFGSGKSYYLVNGSTCGILSAICAGVPRHGTILFVRNSHKSAYHAAFLNELNIEYLYPGYIREYGIVGGIFPEDVEAALGRNPEIRAVFITSPTYDGAISDIRRIVDICHKRNVLCIVDEAHGAHLGLWGEGIDNSCRLGADIVIHSIHKTLPAPTQTALLHVNGELVDRELLEYYLRIFQTSSPSYVLMAGIEQCLQIIKQDGGGLHREFKENRAYFLDKLRKLKHIGILTGDSLDERMKKRSGILGMDVCKLLISVKDTDISGKQLYNKLRDEYHLQMEMAGDSYVTAIVTVMDTREGFSRLAAALGEIDSKLVHKPDAGQYQPYSGRHRCVKTVYGAGMLPKEQIAAEAAVGRIAGSFINLYPPGIPVVVPGEIFTEEIITYILNCQNTGYKVQGLDEITKKVTVVMV